MSDTSSKNKGCKTDSDILGELHSQNEELISLSSVLSSKDNPYLPDDLSVLHDVNLSSLHNPSVWMETLDELLQRDEQRVKDNFHKKITVKRVPVGDKIIIVPSTVEEKLVHGDFSPGQLGDGSGQGEGEEGDVLGEQPLDDDGGDGEGEADQPGDGSGGDHGIDTEAYELGEKLTEQFELPNLQDKGKKVPTNEYTHELTDIHRGSGQVLDKKRTLARIVKTNIGLGRLNPDNPDTTRLIIAPSDKVYRTVSRERKFVSRAVVFFVRDYSGSMSGKPAFTVVQQHVIIYSWLLNQYEKLVDSRFILHDTEPKEAPNFNVYFKSKVAGGTKIAPAFKMINDIVFQEGLARDYNVYIFYGSDGDDWDDGTDAIEQIGIALDYANRVGISIIRNSWTNGPSKMEKYIENSNLLKQNDVFRFVATANNMVNEKSNIEAIKHLISA